MRPILIAVENLVITMSLRSCLICIHCFVAGLLLMEPVVEDVTYPMDFNGPSLQR